MPPPSPASAVELVGNVFQDLVQRVVKKIVLLVDDPAQLRGEVARIGRPGIARGFLRPEIALDARRVGLIVGVARRSVCGDQIINGVGGHRWFSPFCELKKGRPRDRPSIARCVPVRRAIFGGSGPLGHGLQVVDDVGQHCPVLLGRLAALDDVLVVAGQYRQPVEIGELAARPG